MLDHELVKEVFFEVSQRPPAERSAFLEEACAGSDALLREVKSLLAFHDVEAGSASPPIPAGRLAGSRPRFRRGQVLAGRFRVERSIGRGGMGEVYAAFDRLLGMEVAVKTLRFAQDVPSRGRLLEEVRLARQVSHPGVCRVHDVGDHRGTPFLTMELVDGEDLAARLARSGPWSSTAVAALGAKLADALAAAHAAGVLHRDLKPANLLIDRTGGLHITDFGIASLGRGRGSGGGEGTRFGTPSYMAPESATPGYVPDERSDLYSLGVVLYELLTGRPPSEVGDLVLPAELHRRLAPDPRPRGRPPVDPQLETLILALLATNAADRPASAGAVAAALASLEGESASTPESRAAEQRPLVALLCEFALEGSEDRPVSRDILATVRARSALLCLARGGRVAQHVERGLIVHFGYPEATEHDLENAVQAGLEILEQVHRLDASVADAGLRPAVAVHADTALISPSRRGDPTISGGPFDLALLRRLLMPDAVRVSRSSLPLLRGALASQRLEAVADEGAPTPGAEVAVRGGARRGTGMEVTPAGVTSFVGRDLELAQLLRRWEDARDGRGQIVLLEGEAGAGKSRLIHELWSRVSDQGSGYAVYCTASQTGSPGAPLLDLVRRIAGFQESDDERQRLHRLRAALEPLGSRAHEVLPSFLTWLVRNGEDGRSSAAAASATATTDGRRFFLRALVDWILALSEAKPLVLVIEDLHWSDPTTLEALDLLVEHGATARLLLVLAFRPELQAPWSGRHVSPIALQPLRVDEARALVGAAVAGAPLAPPVVERIVASAEGNPLFIEELARDALERGRPDPVERGVGGEVPLTLQSLLQARLDRLGSARAIAQAAAVCGRTFRHELLASVVDLDDAARSGGGLDRLHDAKLLYQRGAPPHAVYTFKHALVREAVYGSIPARQREAVHRKVAEVLPAMDAEGVAARPETVARHWMAGGRPALAFPWWRRAALLALEHCAYAEALTALEQARRTLAPWRRETATSSPAVELEILLGVLAAYASHVGTAPAGVKSILRRVRALSADPEAGELRVLALFNLARFRIAASERTGLLPLMRRAEALAERAQDRQAASAVWSQMAHVFAVRARYANAEVYSERCLAGGAPPTTALLAAVATDPRATAAYARSICHWARGRASALERDATAVMMEIDRNGSPNTRVFARALQSVPMLLAGAHEVAGRLVREALEIAAVADLAAGTRLARFAKVINDAARATASWHELADAMAARESGGELRLIGVARLVLATALERIGEHERALAVLEEGCGRANDVLNRFTLPELHRRRGEALARLGRTDQAESALRRGLSLARHDGAFRLELRAASSLARFLAARGATRAARRALEASLQGLDAAVDTGERDQAEALLADVLGAEDGP